jgi:hypothetical protein
VLVVVSVIDDDCDGFVFVVVGGGVRLWVAVLLLHACYFINE